MAKNSSVAEKRYIRLIDTWGGKIAELSDEYELGRNKVPMYDFYNADGRLFCIKQKDAEIISEKEYFVARLSGTEIFNE